ncbi:MAG: DUF4214 domain-containing protein [Pseudomonadota bacterium]
MTFDIEFDYSLDSSGFFDDPAVRAVLEAAAAEWEGIILDEFEDVPAGIAFDVSDPNGGPGSFRVVLDQPIDDVLIFVGATDLPDSLGFGGPTGLNLDGFLVGDALGRRFESDFRGDGPVTDVEYYAGVITFATNVNWNISLDPPGPFEDDLYTTVLHEIGHVLGVGTSAAFDTQVSNGRAVGPNALAVTDGAGVPLDDTLHVLDGFNGDQVLLDPITITGTTKTATDIDLALLADIGFEIEGFSRQGSQPALVTEGPDVTIFGTNIGEVINALGGDDFVQGDDGADTLLGGFGDDIILGEFGNDSLNGGPGDDQLQGGQGNDTLRAGGGNDQFFGDAGADVYRIEPGDGAIELSDFDFNLDTIEIDAGFGFTTDAEVLATAERPFTNTTLLRLNAQTTVEIFHEVLSGIPITANDIVVLGATTGGVVEGTLGDDQPPALQLEGGIGDDTVRAFAGDDVVFGSEGSDVIEGGDGTDRAIYDGSSAAFVPDLGSDGSITLAKPGGQADLLTGIERIDLDDGDYLYDISGNNLDIGYRLYAAAFARTPDEGGLRFWVSQLDASFGVRNAALAFISSDEFAVRYGEDPSDEDYVTALFENVLMRAPDAAGLSFWTDAFASGALDRADMLIAFANAQENIDATRPVIDDGVFVMAPELDLLG